MADRILPEFTCTLSDDQHEVTVQVGGETFVADAATLQNVVAQLGAVRAQLAPAVDFHSPDDRQFLQIGGPVLEIVESDDKQVVRIAFRTPQYGWIGFQFSPGQAVEVGRYLVANFASDPASKA